MKVPVIFTSGPQLRISVSTIFLWLDLGDVTVKDSSLTIWFSEKELENAPWYLWLAHRIIRDPWLGFHDSRLLSQ